MEYIEVLKEQAREYYKNQKIITKGKAKKERYEQIKKRKKYLKLFIEYVV